MPSTVEVWSLYCWIAMKVLAWPSLILMISVSPLLARGLPWEHLCICVVCMWFMLREL